LEEERKRKNPPRERGKSRRKVKVGKKERAEPEIMYRASTLCAVIKSERLERILLRFSLSFFLFPPTTYTHEAASSPSSVHKGENLE
jgi:hypothetical protein